MKQIVVDGMEFSLPDEVVEAYKFDETDKAAPHYHGASMLKAVDVMIEYPGHYVFVEIKSYDAELKTEYEKAGSNAVAFLKQTLVRKFRDTYLYRHCEEKTDKDIYYICLLEHLDGALLGKMRKELQYLLPVERHNPARWKHGIAANVFVVNADTWNRNFAERGFGSVRKI